MTRLQGVRGPAHICARWLPLPSSSQAVTSVDRRPIKYLLAASLLVACGGGDKPTPATDTTPTDTAAAAEAAPAPATASKVGALPLLARLSPDHACSSQNFEG